MCTAHQQIYLWVTILHLASLPPNHTSHASEFHAKLSCCHEDGCIVLNSSSTPLHDLALRLLPGRRLADLLARAGNYLQNCSAAEAMVWLDAPEVTDNQPASLPQHPRSAGLAIAAPNATFVSPLPGPVGILAPAVRASASKALPATAQKQQSAMAAQQTAAATANFVPSAAAAGQQSARATGKRLRTTATPTGMGAGLGTVTGTGKCNSGSHAQGIPVAPSEQVAATTGRESFGGTQGAITGLTRMALQKHNELQADMTHLPPALGLDVTDTQAMAQQVSCK